MMVNKAAIIGAGPLKSDILRQYGEMGTEVTEVAAADFDRAVDDGVLAGIGEMVILPMDDGEESGGVDADARSLAMLQRIADLIGGERITVHLQLQSPATMRVLLMADLPESITDKIDVYPFVAEDIWARKLVAPIPGEDAEYPLLDRDPIDERSDKHVHLVIVGFDSYAEAVAIQTALTMHFPNYRSKDPRPLRTRITIIDADIAARRDEFIARYSSLFDNSMWRSIEPDARRAFIHKPRYHGKRLDFVDVEWEFVDAPVSHPEVMNRLERWAADDTRLLSVIVSHADVTLNLTRSAALPEAVYDRGIPVFVRQNNATLVNQMRLLPKYACLYPFGMTGCGYDVTMPHIRLAKLLNYFYAASYGDTGVPTELPHDLVENAWQETKSLKLRHSSVCNVITMTTKMHILGHDPRDAENFYALTRREVETLARTEHNRWSVDRLISGSRPCTDAERDEIRADLRLKKWYKKNRDVHFDLCAFEELGFDETGKNVQVYDYDLTACIPLMVKTFFDRSPKKGK